MVLAKSTSLVAELTLGATASAFSGLRPESSNLTSSFGVGVGIEGGSWTNTISDSS